MGKSAFGIIELDGLVLIGKKILEVKSPLAGHWLFPGGGVKDGETTIDALTRELKEETGLRTHPEAYIAFTIDKKGRELYWQRCTITGGREEAGSDICELRWEPKNNILKKCHKAAAYWPPGLITYLQDKPSNQ